MTESTLFQKIPGPFLRDPETNKLTREWAAPEFKALQWADAWIFTEKIDGTNIRVIWDGYRVTFGGRTDNAVIPAPLLTELEALFGGEDKETLFEQKFGETPVMLYGEGYGAKIQKGGGNYRPSAGFILFDVVIGGFYLLRDNIEDIGSYFGVDVVPIVVRGDLWDGIGTVEQGLTSTFGNFRAEGLVGVTDVGLLNRQGKRIIVKIKDRDFAHATIQAP